VDLKSKQMKNAFALISFAIILMFLLENIIVVKSVLLRLLSIISPFLIGGSIAFILNNPMMFIERTFFNSRSPLHKTDDKLKRIISYLLTLILFVGTIIIIFLIIIPELITTIEDLSNKLPDYIDEIRAFIISKVDDNQKLVEWMNNINIDWPGIEQNVISYFQRSILDWINSTFSFASSIFGAIITFVLAFIFSIYILLQKETLLMQAKKVILAYFSKKRSERIFYIGNLSNTVFENFISGQLLEALIIGGIFLVAMIIFKFPYALMISLIIALTALIPMVGAFIGCIIGIFFIMVVDPIKALWFAILFIIIQQIEGNLIYPNVVGKAAGLPSIWILVAVTVGGSLAGVLGILFFIPIGSILYTLLREEINYRLKQKDISD